MSFSPYSQEALSESGAKNLSREFNSGKVKGSRGQLAIADKHCIAVKEKSVFMVWGFSGYCIIALFYYCKYMQFKNPMQH